MEEFTEKELEVLRVCFYFIDWVSLKEGTGMSTDDLMETMQSIRIKIGI